MSKRNHLVWIDLEMTGLNPDHEVIVEISTLITNKNLEIVAEGPSFVIHQPDHVLANMHEEVKKIHSSSGLIHHIRSSTTTLEQAQAQTLAFIQEHCAKNTAPLCGNSIWKDKSFLERYMPEVVNHLHYRLIDVSTVKILVQQWYASHPHVKFEKKNSHRALDDIIESIAELKHYKRYFFVPTGELV